MVKEIEIKERIEWLKRFYQDNILFVTEDLTESCLTAVTVQSP